MEGMDALDMSSQKAVFSIVPTCEKRAERVASRWSFISSSGKVFLRRSTTGVVHVCRKLWVSICVANSDDD